MADHTNISTERENLIADIMSMPDELISQVVEAITELRTKIKTKKKPKTEPNISYDTLESSDLLQFKFVPLTRDELYDRYENSIAGKEYRRKCFENSIMVTKPFKGSVPKWTREELYDRLENSILGKSLIKEADV